MDLNQKLRALKEELNQREAEKDNGAMSFTESANL
jgi:hypothetical protein